MPATGPITADIGLDQNYIIGDRRPLAFTVVDGAGVAVNTGAYTMQWRLLDGDDVVITVPDASMVRSNDAGTNDVLTFAITVAQSLLLAAGRYRHVLERIDAPTDNLAFSRGAFHAQLV